MASKIKNSSKLNRLYWILVIALFLLAFVIWFYFNEFGYLKVDTNTFGTFGDFVGGVLNPLFALFSLFAIIYTIKIQAQELEYSREELESTKEELEKSRVAQEEQSKSLQLQNEATKLQMFENTFFQLMDLHNKRFDALKNNLSRYNGVILSDNQSSDTKDYMIGMYKKNKEGELSTYITILFTLLKYIDKEEDNSLYIDLIKSIMTQNSYILTYVAIECDSNLLFKNLIEKYALLENLNLLGRKRLNEITLILKEIDPKAFGQNEYVNALLAISNKTRP